MGGSTLRVWRASPAFDSPAAEKVMGRRRSRHGAPRAVYKGPAPAKPAKPAQPARTACSRLPPSSSRCAWATARMGMSVFFPMGKLHAVYPPIMSCHVLIQMIPATSRMQITSAVFTQMSGRGLLMLARILTKHSVTRRISSGVLCRLRRPKSCRLVQSAGSWSARTSASLP